MVTAIGNIIIKLVYPDVWRNLYAILVCSHHLGRRSSFRDRITRDLGCLQCLYRKYLKKQTYADWGGAGRFYLSKSVANARSSEAEHGSGMIAVQFCTCAFRSELLPHSNMINPLLLSILLFPLNPSLTYVQICCQYVALLHRKFDAGSTLFLEAVQNRNDAAGCSGFVVSKDSEAHGFIRKTHSARIGLHQLCQSFKYTDVTTIRRHLFRHLYYFQRCCSRCKGSYHLCISDLTEGFFSKALPRKVST